MEAALAFSKASQEKLQANPQQELETEVKEIALVGSKLESQTFYKSSYFQDSYQFPWNPDPLVAGNTYKIYDEMRMDDQINVVLEIKKDFVTNAGWTIKCENKEIKEFITNNLKNLDSEYGLEPTFEEILRDLLTSYDYGFSLAEPTYKFTEQMLYEYKSIAVRPPHSFRFDIDKFGKVTKITQSTEEGEKEFDAKIFLHIAYRQEFGNPYGRSDLRSAHLAWRAKKFFMKFFNIYVERFANPLIVGKYPENWLPDQVTAFFNTLSKIQNNSVLALQKDVLIDLMQNNRDASSIYIDGMNFYNMQIARSILVPDLLGVGGSETKGGSFALGKEQFKLFINTIKKDKHTLQSKITQRLIKPLAFNNWGEDKCEFILTPYTHEDEMDLARLWLDAVKTPGRVYNPTEEEVYHFKNIIRFPESPITLYDPMLQQVNPQGNPLTPAETTPKDENEAGKKEEVEAEDKEEKQIPEAPSEKKQFRDLTPYESKINFTDIKKVLNVSEETVTPKIKRAGRDIYMDYLAQIRDKNILSNFKPEQIENLQPKFLRRMNAVFKNHFKDLFTQGMNSARAELFPNGTKNFVEDGLLPEEFLDVLDAESFKIVGDYTNEITKKAKNTLIKGMKDGVGQSELYTMIRDEMEGASEKWIAAVIRTKTTEIYNTARKIYWENDPLAKQIVEAYQFSAILDDRTSDVCESLNGMIFEKGDFVDRITPPLHINCRSMLVPITKFEDYKADREPSLESLKNKGGGLIAFELGSPSPNIILSGNVKTQGDTALIAPTFDQYIQILSLKVSNIDMDYTVTVGFKSTNDPTLKWTQMLESKKGVLNQDFRNNPWILPAGAGLNINLSTNANIAYTCEYIIVNPMGQRIL